MLDRPLLLRGGLDSRKQGCWMTTYLAAVACLTSPSVGLQLILDDLREVPQSLVEARKLDFRYRGCIVLGALHYIV